MAVRDTKGKQLYTGEQLIKLSQERTEELRKDWDAKR
jgi:hypothetical protein